MKCCFLCTYFEENLGTLNLSLFPNVFFNLYLIEFWFQEGMV